MITDLTALGEFYKQDTTALFHSIHKKHGPVAKFPGMFGKPDVVVVFDAESVAQVSLQV